MAASEDIQTDLNRDPDWWANWFEQDFSWEGLKQKWWRGWVVVDETRCMPMVDAPEDATVREANLQDYWRADPKMEWILRELGAPGETHSGAELVQLEEIVWHRAHLPPATLLGVRSWKADPEDNSYKNIGGCSRRIWKPVWRTGLSPIVMNTAFGKAQIAVLSSMAS